MKKDDSFVWRKQPVRYVLTVVVDNQKFIRPLRNKIGGLPKEARASLSAHFADQIDSAFPMTFRHTFLFS